MKKNILLLLVLFGFISVAKAQVDGLPGTPDPGKCYVKCITPDEFKTETVKVKVRDAYKVLTVVPAKYKWVTEKVMVKEPSKKFIYHPAVYKTVEVPYVKKEASKKLKVIPAKFGKGSETVEIFPETGKWQYSNLPDCASGNPEDCKTLCYVTTEAQTKVIPTTPLVKDATVEETPVPEVKATYKKLVVDKPAYTEEVEIPAQYATIKKQVLVEPAKVVEKTIPAKYIEVKKQVLVKKGGLTVWEEIDCALVKPTKLNIHWNVNSAKLTPQAKHEIDTKLLSLLKSKPNISVEIASHTDSRGSAAYNQALSQRRADAVKNYLISKGISPSRIVSKGYGESRLLNNCKDGVPCSEAQHRVNRRTEFRIIGQ